ncbi:MAG: FKBP-type peptidyl-prolyl cis-trans isomerase [Bacteroidales bacterium]|nr:FKBP-type peptidyl-prolyl cis-trans isomerase [Bacteroidales bacterium]MBN2748103.1 FKBP-type peptidyl-prolyl cis-trans isomerase [Bacteroidales bacterium]
MRKLSNFSLLLLIVAIGFWCCNGSGKKQPPVSLSQAKEQLEGINKELVKNDKEQIEAYLKRYALDSLVAQNGAGLYYIIYGDALGAIAEKGQLATISYKVSLLDGSICYGETTPVQEQFLVGQGGVVSGLEQGVLLMRVGQKAKFILPPHLAHGLVGDGSKIPPRAILVYDVELLSLH